MAKQDTTANNSAHPYEDLTPDCILDALEAVGFEPTGSLLALNSYENRVYQASLEDGSFVIAKFPSSPRSQSRIKPCLNLSSFVLPFFHARGAAPQNLNSLKHSNSWAASWGVSMP